MSYVGPRAHQGDGSLREAATCELQDGIRTVEGSEHGWIYGARDLCRDTSTHSFMGRGISAGIPAHTAHVASVPEVTI